uniref:Uncharacterized protein n=1 Tax=Glossina palpalis gambiensis TaxID=67801 RepID=A0A1B0B6Q4_9MUSC
MKLREIFLNILVFRRYFAYVGHAGKFATRLLPFSELISGNQLAEDRFGSIGEKENEEKLCNFLSNQWHVRPNQIDINEQRCTSNEKCSYNILKTKSALKTNQTQHQHQHQYRSYLVEFKLPHDSSKRQATNRTCNLL